MRRLRESEWRTRGTGAVAAAVLGVADVSGYWLQVDVDVLDPEVMPAVDSPDPGGCTADELVELLRALAPRAVGASVTVFDPDLDPDGRYARVVSDVVVDGLAGLGSALRGRGPG
ncbi:arginase family protein [Clavibacter sp. Sh2141]|uniref:arginase family protein n=1 Tax=Clavibacter sp. Sh2141 TaxID=3395374 RepID=UPI0039BCBC8B